MLEAFLRDQRLKVFARVHPLEFLRPVLKRLGFVTAEELKKLPPGKEAKVSGLVILVHTPPVRSGKRIMFVTLEDETGLIDTVILPEVQKDCGKAVLTEEIVFLKGKVR